MKKRLYHCSAYYTRETDGKIYILKLISYNTKICEVIYEKLGYYDYSFNIKLWRYPSITSQQHIRKFANLLIHDKDFKVSGYVLKDLQDCCVERKCNYGTYDGVFNLQNYNISELKKLGFEYNKPY